ncbi:MAG: hypothetical protein Aurels2KO_01410 [Aureliella sp.]
MQLALEKAATQMFPNLWLLLQCCATWGMVGLIWIVQLVHYPMFSSLEPGQFTKHMEDHQKQISLVVLPLMMVELVSCLAMLWARPPAIPLSQVTAGLVLLAICWGSTFLIQVPQHTRLLQGYDADVCRQLVSYNWIRTVAWSLRGLLVAVMLWLTLKN